MSEPLGLLPEYRNGLGPDAMALRILGLDAYFQPPCVLVEALGNSRARNLRGHAFLDLLWRQPLEFVRILGDDLDLLLAVYVDDFKLAVLKLA